MTDKNAEASGAPDPDSKADTDDVAADAADSGTDPDTKKTDDVAADAADSGTDPDTKKTEEVAAVGAGTADPAAPDSGTDPDADELATGTADSSTAADSGTPEGTGAADADDLAALRAENEALRAQLAQAPEATPSKGIDWRSIGTWILSFLAILSVVLAVFAVWLKTTITDEDRFVATFGSLPEQEEVVTALSQRVADDLIVAADVEAVLSGSLPSEIAFLSVPVTEGVRQLTTKVAADIIATDVFAGIWRAALRISHQAVDAVLATGGSVTIDLDEAAETVTAALAERGITVFEGQDVDLPEIVLFENEQIAAVAQVVNFVDTLGWVMPLIALVFVVAAIWVSPNRRKTVALLGFATGIVLILDLAILRIIRANSAGAVEDEVSRAAAEAAWDSTLRFYTQGVWAVIALAFVVGFVAWVFGPSARAVRARGAWNAMIARWSGPDTGKPRSGFSKFVSNNQRAIQWGAVILGLLFILFGPAPSVVSVIITALIVLAVVGFAQAVGGPGSPDTGPAETGEVLVETQVSEGVVEEDVVVSSNPSG